MLFRDVFNYLLRACFSTRNLVQQPLMIGIGRSCKWSHADMPYVQEKATAFTYGTSSTN
jgi:hypothetical protein